MCIEIIDLSIYLPFLLCCTVSVKHPRIAAASRSSTYFVNNILINNRITEAIFLIDHFLLMNSYARVYNLTREPTDSFEF